MKYFNPELTPESLYFDIFVAVLVVGVMIYGFTYYKFFVWRFFALAFGVLCFEFLTSSLWVTANLGTYSYLNGDVSIIMTLLWTSIIFFVRFLFDRFLKKSSILSEYVFVVSITSIVGLSIIVLLKSIGVFYYSPEMMQIVNSSILIFGRPLEAIVYFPTFIFIAYSFYKYWELAMYNKLYYLDYSLKPTWDIAIAVIIVMLIGYLMHPLLMTHSIFAYIALIFVIILSLLLVNLTISNATHFPLFVRYLLGTILLSLLVSAFLSFFIEYGYITLSESLKINYTERTIMIPGFQFTDSEMVGIFFFSYLLIANIKYFKTIVRHGNIHIQDDTMTFRGWKSIFR